LKQEKYEKILENLTSYESIPEKMLLTKQVKKVLWKILLFNEGFSDKHVGNIWMLASGAASE
jgi:hypothetical protein